MEIDRVGAEVAAAEAEDPNAHVKLIQRVKRDVIQLIEEKKLEEDSSTALREVHKLLITKYLVLWKEYGAVKHVNCYELLHASPKAPRAELQQRWEDLKTSVDYSGNVATPKPVETLLSYIKQQLLVEPNRIIQTALFYPGVMYPDFPKIAALRPFYKMWVSRCLESQVDNNMSDAPPQIYTAWDAQGAVTLYGEALWLAWLFNRMFVSSPSPLDKFATAIEQAPGRPTDVLASIKLESRVKPSQVQAVVIRDGPPAPVVPVVPSAAPALIAPSGLTLPPAAAARAAEERKAADAPPPADKEGTDDDAELPPVDAAAASPAKKKRASKPKSKKSATTPIQVLDDPGQKGMTKVRLQTLLGDPHDADLPEALDVLVKSISCDRSDADKKLVVRLVSLAPEPLAALLATLRVSEDEAGEKKMFDTVLFDDKVSANRFQQMILDANITDEESAKDFMTSMLNMDRTSFRWTATPMKQPKIVTHLVSEVKRADGLPQDSPKGAMWALLQRKTRSRSWIDFIRAAKVSDEKLQRWLTNVPEWLRDFVGFSLPSEKRPAHLHDGRVFDNLVKGLRTNIHAWPEELRLRTMRAIHADYSDTLERFFYLARLIENYTANAAGFKARMGIVNKQAYARVKKMFALYAPAKRQEIMDRLTWIADHKVLVSIHALEDEERKWLKDNHAVMQSECDSLLGIIPRHYRYARDYLESIRQGVAVLASKNRPYPEDIAPLLDRIRKQPLPEQLRVLSGLRESLHILEHTDGPSSAKEHEIKTDKDVEVEDTKGGKRSRKKNTEKYVEDHPWIAALKRFHEKVTDIWLPLLLGDETKDLPSANLPHSSKPELVDREAVIAEEKESDPATLEYIRSVPLSTFHRLYHYEKDIPKRNRDADDSDEEDAESQKTTLGRVADLLRAEFYKQPADTLRFVWYSEMKRGRGAASEVDHLASWFERVLGRLKIPPEFLGYNPNVAEIENDTGELAEEPEEGAAVPRSLAGASKKPRSVGNQEFADMKAEAEETVKKLVDERFKGKNVDPRLANHLKKTMSAVLLDRYGQNVDAAAEFTEFCENNYTRCMLCPDAVANHSPEFVAEMAHFVLTTENKELKPAFDIREFRFMDNQADSDLDIEEKGKWQLWTHMGCIKAKCYVTKPDRKNDPVFIEYPFSQAQSDTDLRHNVGIDDIERIVGSDRMHTAAMRNAQRAMEGYENAKDIALQNAVAYDITHENLGSGFNTEAPYASTSTCLLCNQTGASAECVLCQQDHEQDITTDGVYHMACFVKGLVGHVSEKGAIICNKHDLTGKIETVTYVKNIAAKRENKRYFELAEVEVTETFYPIEKHADPLPNYKLQLKPQLPTLLEQKEINDKKREAAQKEEAEKQKRREADRLRNQTRKRRREPDEVKVVGGEAVPLGTALPEAKRLRPADSEDKSDDDDEPLPPQPMEADDQEKPDAAQPMEADEEEEDEEENEDEDDSDGPPPDASDDAVASATEARPMETDKPEDAPPVAKPAPPAEVKSLKGGDLGPPAPSVDEERASKAEAAAKAADARARLQRELDEARAKATAEAQEQENKRKAEQDRLAQEQKRKAEESAAAAEQKRKADEAAAAAAAAALQEQKRKADEAKAEEERIRLEQEQKRKAEEAQARERAAQERKRKADEAAAAAAEEKKAAVPPPAAVVPMDASPLAVPSVDRHVPPGGIKFDTNSVPAEPDEMDTGILESLCMPVSKFTALMNTPKDKGFFRVRLTLENHPLSYVAYAYIFSRGTKRLYTWFPGLAAAPEDMDDITQMYATCLPQPAEFLWNVSFLPYLRPLDLVPGHEGDVLYRSVGYVTDTVNGVTQRKEMFLRILEPRQ